MKVTPPESVFPVIEFIYRKHHFSVLRWHMLLKCFLIEYKDLLIMHWRYCSLALSHWYVLYIVSHQTWHWLSWSKSAWGMDITLSLLSPLHDSWNDILQRPAADEKFFLFLSADPLHQSTRGAMVRWIDHWAKNTVWVFMVVGPTGQLMMQCIGDISQPFF